MPIPKYKMETFVNLKDKRKAKTAIRVLKEVVAGKKVSPARLKRTQDFILKFLNEANSKRPPLKSII